MRRSIFAVAALAFLAGCGSHDEAGRTDAKPLTADQQAQQIQNDANLSPEARADALASQQKAKTMGDAMRKAHDAGK